MDKKTYMKNFDAVMERYPSAICDGCDYALISIPDFLNDAEPGYRSDLLTVTPGITDCDLPNREYCSSQMLLIDENKKYAIEIAYINDQEIIIKEWDFEDAGQDTAWMKELLKEYEDILTRIDSVHKDRVFVEWFKELEIYLPKYQEIYKELPEPEPEPKPKPEPPPKDAYKQLPLFDNLEQ